MEKKRWIAAAACGLLLLTGCSGKPADPQVSIEPTSGYEVMSSEGQYFFLITVLNEELESPTVVLRKLVRDKETKTAVVEKSYDVTDRDDGGVYCLTVTEQGDYELEISAPGYVTEQLLVVVEDQPMYFLPVRLTREGATEEPTDPTGETVQPSETVTDPTETAPEPSEVPAET